MTYERKDEGAGLYTKEQEKYTTPFQYFGQIVVGAVFFLSGVGVLISVLGTRSEETLHFGSPEPHLTGFIAAAALMLIGIGMAHAGVIFWVRRLRAGQHPHHREPRDRQ